MSVSGINSYNHANFYQGNVNRSNKQVSNLFSSTSSNINLHMTDSKNRDKALTSVGIKMENYLMTPVILMKRPILNH